MRQLSQMEARELLRSNPFPNLETVEGRWFALGFFKSLFWTGQLSNEDHEILFAELASELGILLK